MAIIRRPLLTDSYTFDPITNNKKNVKVRANVEVDDTSPSTPPSVSDANGEKFAQWLLEEFDYNNETLMVAPAAGFYSTEGEGYNQVRIAYVLNLDSLKKAIKCLEEAIKLYPGRI